MLQISKREAEKKLFKLFGLRKFHENQWKAVDNIFKGKRVLLIEKTGYGKSLCYQFPATQFLGTTVIFSPLIALMRDQIKKLNDAGIAARCINSEQTREENDSVIKEALENKLKLLYIAPERMENAQWLESAREMFISMVVIDEAHCISQWGHDFRPAYRRIVNLVNLLPKQFPVLATTATATKRVEKDVQQQIGKNTIAIRGNLMRKNFRLFVIHVNSEEEKFAWLGKNLNNLEGNGIIYTGTRINTMVYTNWLNSLGISCVGYNAGLDGDSRKQIERGLIENTWKCIVSTNALGMGIDKPDIRFIIHTQITQSPIHYYQEIGRAGRDDKTAFLILFYNPSDRDLPEAFIEGDRPTSKKYYQVIDLLRERPLSTYQLMKETNLTNTQIRTIVADLVDQSIINESFYGRSRKFEYSINAPQLNTGYFEMLRSIKLKELNDMIEYAEGVDCRLAYLCKYLGDKAPKRCGRCDNDIGKSYNVDFYDEWKDRVEAFQQNYFPELSVDREGTNMKDGAAGAYYGVSNIGHIIHNCKYKNGGDFPDSLVDLTLRAFQKNFSRFRFDLILYVPPTESGCLVRNFAMKISQLTGIPVSHKLFKTRPTEPQKVFQNFVLKRDNVKDAFVYHKPKEIGNKNILLVDDIYDSGSTIKEIGKYLTKLGAKKITPLVIAKTVGGRIDE